MACPPYDDHSDRWWARRKRAFAPPYGRSRLWFLRPDGQITTRRAKCCPAPFAKIFRFFRSANHLYIVPHPVPDTEGRWPSSTDVERGMRWTRRRAPAFAKASADWHLARRSLWRRRETSAVACGRRSRVVLTPRRWRQVLRRDPQGDGGKKARSPGRARRKPLKPSRGECRLIAAYLW